MTSTTRELAAQSAVLGTGRCQFAVLMAASLGIGSVLPGMRADCCQFAVLMAASLGIGSVLPGMRADCCQFAAGAEAAL